MKRLKKIDWESGISESIAFISIFPFVIACLYLMFYAMQTSYVKQSLQFASYGATRASVVNVDYEDAMEAANSIVNNALPNGYMGISESYFSLDTVEGYATDWKKGNLRKGTVTVSIKSIIPFKGTMPREISAYTIMMIERPI